LCLIVATALFQIATQPDDEPAARRRLRWFTILSLIGVSWMAKFHYGAAMVLAPTCVFWTMQRRWRRFLDLFNPLGLLVVLACVVVWPWLVWRQLPEALSVWKAETVGRAIGELGRDPWWFYLPLLAALTLPWQGHIVLAAPSSLRRAWRLGDERERFLWTWLIVDLSLVWLQPDKHENYLLAAMPPFTLLACQTWARVMAKIRRGVLRLPVFATWGGLAAAVALGVWLFVSIAPRWPTAQRDLQWAAICLASSWTVSKRRH